MSSPPCEKNTWNVFGIDTDSLACGHLSDLSTVWANAWLYRALKEEFHLFDHIALDQLQAILFALLLQEPLVQA